MQAVLASTQPVAGRKLNGHTGNLVPPRAIKQSVPAASIEVESRSAFSLRLAGIALLAAVAVGGNSAPRALANNGQAAPAGTVIAGKARVVDGDTLVVGTERIRLYGVDAPESKQTCRLRGADWACGKAAAEALQKELDRIGSNSVKCTVINGDMYGRDVAKCQAANGEDINGWMVSQGWALAYRQYSKDFIPLEEKARSQSAGVWQSEFQMPWEWRKANRAGLSTDRPGPAVSTVSGPQPAAMGAMAPTAAPAKPAAAPPTSGCLIKGNIGSSGEKIYHVPGGKSYERTVINEKQGERYFCSPEDARAAGWRPASD